MATLLGIKKYIPTSNISTDSIRQAENYIKTHTDETGQVSDSQVYNNAISILAPLSDDLQVANKIADYKNKAAQLDTKVENAENDLNMFKYKLDASIMDVTKDSKGDAQSLVFSIANKYQIALDEFNDVILDKVLSSIPKGQKVPQTILDYKDELSGKVKTMTDLANSYLIQDPKTKLNGPTTPDAYGVLIKTNPQTGAIVNFDIQEVNSMDKVAGGYTKTNARYGRLPIYLNTYTDKRMIKGNLGGIEFVSAKEDVEVGGTTVGKNILMGKFGEEAGGIGVGAWLSRMVGSIGEGTKVGLKEQQQEFNLAAIPFDYYSIPANSVVKDGKGNYYWLDNGFKLYKAKDRDILQRYLQSIGQGSYDVNNSFLAHPDFISQYYKVDKNGNENYIDENSFKSILNSAGQVNNINAYNPVNLSNIPSLSAKTGGMTTPATMGLSVPKTYAPKGETSLKPSQEYISGTGYETKKIIAKGESIIKSHLPFA